MKKIVFGLIISMVSFFTWGMEQEKRMSEIYNELQKLEDKMQNRLQVLSPDLESFIAPLESDLSISLLFDAEKAEGEREVEVNSNSLQGRFDALCIERPVLDFSSFSFKETVIALTLILQSKLDARIGKWNGCYRTEYCKFQYVDDSDDEQDLQHQHFGESFLDPYYAKIRIKNEYFNFSLDYNGFSDQPGNCVIRQSRHKQYYKRDAPTTIEKREKAKEWKEIKKDSLLEKLLLAVEVARRKVHDGVKKDRYFSLPIWCAIVIAQDLSEKRPYEYGIFSGSQQDRENGTKFIIASF